MIVGMIGPPGFRAACPCPVQKVWPGVDGGTTPKLELGAATDAAKLTESCWGGFVALAGQVLGGLPRIEAAAGRFIHLKTPS